MRIVIIGKPGSGKSTFAYNLAQKLTMPLCHLDKIFFVKNWEYRDYYDFLSDQLDMVDKDEWIIDGNSLQSLGTRYERATHVIYFNYPRWICLWRMLKRVFFPSPKIDDTPEGCTKNISWRLITYLWNYEKRLTPLLKCMRRLYPKKPLFIINSDQELADLEKKLYKKHLKRIKNMRTLI